LKSADTRAVYRQQAPTRRPRRSPSSLVGWASGIVFVLVVAALTFATRDHELPLAPFAASAAKIASGQLWVLPASALVVDRPVLIGLVAFTVLAAATLRFCGPRTFWLAAGAGHVGSALAVYAIIGAARLADPHVFTNAVVSQDFGVSAMQGAWVGAIATSAWLRAGRDGRLQVAVAVAVCVVAAVAWWLHPDPSILTTEHLFAFLIGCGIVAAPRLTAARTPGSRRLVSSRENTQSA
jgi:hypothetical protein